jgi:hypothetical protein
MMPIVEPKMYMPVGGSGGGVGVGVACGASSTLMYVCAKKSHITF